MEIDGYHFKKVKKTSLYIYESCKYWALQRMVEDIHRVNKKNEKNVLNPIHMIFQQYWVRRYAYDLKDSLYYDRIEPRKAGADSSVK